MALSTNGWMLYLGGAVAILDLTSSTIYRSMLTKNVNPDEVGKVFSVVATFQALLPFMAGPAYNDLYKYTVSYLPQVWIYLVISIRVFNFFVLLIVTIGMRKQEKRKENDEHLNNNTELDKNLENVVLDPI